MDEKKTRAGRTRRHACAGPLVQICCYGAALERSQSESLGLLPSIVGARCCALGLFGKVRGAPSAWNVPENARVTDSKMLSIAVTVEMIESPFNTVFLIAFCSPIDGHGCAHRSRLGAWLTHV